MAKRKHQSGFFTAGEDSPLFSGVPMTAKSEEFNPQENQQDALFNMRELLPTIGAKKVTEIGQIGTTSLSPAFIDYLELVQKAQEITDEQQ